MSDFWSGFGIFCALVIGIAVVVVVGVWVDSVNEWRKELRFHLKNHLGLDAAFRVSDSMTDIRGRLTVLEAKAKKGR